MLNNEKFTKEEKRLATLAVETEKQKKALLKELRRAGIVQLACERTGVGRSTYYKWRANDNVFARAAGRALEAGQFFINDIAESRLVRLIQDDDLKAIKFWLQHNHPKYTTVNRFIHEYEIVSDRPSVEERNVAEQQLAEIAVAKLEDGPEGARGQVKRILERENEKEEGGSESDKRLQFFEDEDDESKDK
ncbi:hypothetical protein A2823_01550 [Candidatus Nomurabacteria bacterium RIFCSPHIGHO2_01_FULL_41_91]|nr:MAG: hypothetical protein A2823_01550 [Candidatus Nomurabacteria bacterium RIFCSPHIGHO2_01_FULL_41_91]OGI80675.1 MAG: hypothetical protein A3D43_00930 [Candidatus Nomurabacteria bacterium RIFCSPHIGHO2_02_FULL_41_52]OGI84949.1 MAG: hypothetical protein A3F49_00320 [Candidatus Nomurabacteria bacterium RIFCSPHIGHO2_12_FULL_42_19]OGI93765.1 MAG: hypothetical protein A3A07_03005 [Candidatus Nomurabacteria bacterium RIFCSPLOWO2_01_FULL_41_52]OGI98052.1 MAG: hypothetical protein A3H56_02750 [Candid